MQNVGKKLNKNKSQHDPYAIANMSLYFLFREIEVTLSFLAFYQGALMAVDQLRELPQGQQCALLVSELVRVVFVVLEV